MIFIKFSIAKTYVELRCVHQDGFATKLQLNRDYKVVWYNSGMLLYGGTNMGKYGSSNVWWTNYNDSSKEFDDWSVMYYTKNGPICSDHEMLVYKDYLVLFTKNKLYVLNLKVTDKTHNWNEINTMISQPKKHNIGMTMVGKLLIVTGSNDDKECSMHCIDMNQVIMNVNGTHCWNKIDVNMSGIQSHLLIGFSNKLICFQNNTNLTVYDNINTKGHLTALMSGYMKRTEYKHNISLPYDIWMLIQYFYVL